MELDNSSFEASDFNSNLENNSLNTGGPGDPPKKKSTSKTTSGIRPYSRGVNDPFTKLIASETPEKARYINQSIQQDRERQAYYRRVAKAESTINRIKSMGAVEQQAALSILKSKKLDLNNIDSYDDKDFNTYLNAKKQKSALDTNMPYKKLAEKYKAKQKDPNTGFIEGFTSLAGEGKARALSWWNDEEERAGVDPKKYKQLEATIRKYEAPIIQKRNEAYTTERDKKIFEAHSARAKAMGMVAVKSPKGNYEYKADPNARAKTPEEIRNLYRTSTQQMKSAFAYSTMANETKDWLEGKDGFWRGLARGHGLPVLGMVNDLETSIMAARAYKRVEDRKKILADIEQKTGKKQNYIPNADDALLATIATKNEYDITTAGIVGDNFAYRSGKGLGASLVFLEEIFLTGGVGGAAGAGTKLALGGATKLLEKSAVKFGIKKAAEKAFMAEAQNLTTKGLMQLGAEALETSATQAGKRTVSQMARNLGTRLNIPSATNVAGRLGGLAGQVAVMPSTYSKGFNKYVSTNTAIYEGEDGKRNLLIGQEKGKFLSEASRDYTILKAQVDALEKKEKRTELEDLEYEEKAEQLNKLGNTIDYISNLGDNMSLPQALWYGSSENFKEVFAETATAGLIKAGWRSMGMGTRAASKATGLNTFLERTAEKPLIKSVGKGFSTVANKTYRPVGNFFNDIWDRGADLGNKIYQRTGAGKMSQYLAFHSGQNKVFHSLPEELSEEIFVALLPTYGQDYAENLEELQRSNFYIDVLTQTLLMGGGGSLVGSGTHLYNMASDEKYKNNSRELKLQTKSIKDFYKHLDDNLDDIELIEKIAFAAGQTDFNVKDYQAKIEEAKAKGDTFYQQKLEKSYLQSLTARAFRTNTLEEYKRSLSEMKEGTEISDSMRSSIDYTLATLGKFEDAAKKHGGKVHYGDIVNTMLNIDIAEANRTSLLEDLAKSKQSVQEAFEMFNLHENTTGRDLDYDDLDKRDEYAKRYNQLIEKRKSGKELEEWELAEIERNGHRVDGIDRMFEMFENVKDHYLKLSLYNQYREVSYNNQKQLSHQLNPENYGEYVQKFAESLKENAEDIVTPDTAEEIKEIVNKDKPNPNLNRNINKAVVEQTQGRKTPEVREEADLPQVNLDDKDAPEIKASLDNFNNKVASSEVQPQAQISDSQFLDTSEDTGVVPAEVKSEEDQLLAMADSLNFSPITYNKDNEAHKTLVDDLAKPFKKYYDQGYHNFWQMLPSLVDVLGPATVETHFNMMVKAWEKVSGTPIENAQELYNKTFGTVSSEDFKNTTLNKGEVGNPAITAKGPQNVQDETTNDSQQDERFSEEIREENRQHRTMDEQVLSSTDNKILEPLVKTAYLSLEYDRDETTGEKTDATKTVNTTAQPYMHPENFVPGTEQRLEFDFDYLSNEENTLSIWTDINADVPTKKVVSVRKFIEDIFGEGTYDEVLTKLRNEDTRGEILSNEEFLSNIPTKFIVNGNDAPGGINSNSWWNPENVGVPSVEGEPRVDLRNKIIEEARIINMETRKLLAQDGHVVMTVEKILPGYQNEITQEQKENGYFNSVSKAFQDNTDTAVENVSFGLVGTGGTLQTHEENGVSTIKFQGEHIIEDQITNLADWKKGHTEGGGTIAGKPFYIVKNLYKDSEGRDTYSVRSLVTNQSGNTDRMEMIVKMKYALADYAAEYKAYIREGKPIPEHLKKINDNLKKFGVDLKDNSFNTKLGDFYPEEIKDRDKNRLKDENGRQRYKQDIKVVLASTRASQKVLDLSKFDNVQQFKEALASGEGLETTTYNHIIAQNTHTTYLYSEVNDGVHNPVWTSNIQRVIQFNNNHLDNKTLSDQGVQATPVSNAQQLREEIEAREVELRGLQEDLEEIQDEDLRDSIQTEIQDKEKEISKLQEEIKAEESRDALQQEVEVATKTAQDFSDVEEITNPEAEEQKVFTTQDHIDAVNTLYTKAIESAGVGQTFNVSIVKSNLPTAFNNMVRDLRDRGLNQEADYMEENKEIMIGFKGDTYRKGDSNYSNPNYEGSALEYIDAIFDVKHNEEYTELEDDAEAQIVKETYDQESFQINAIDNLSGKAKMIFAGIPDTRHAETGFGGFNKVLHYNHSVEALQQILSEVDNNTLEEIEKNIQTKLNLNDKEFGFYRHMFDRLKNLEKNNPEILRQILGFMYQPKTEMNMVFIESGSVKLLDSNSKSAAIIKARNWKENFKNSPLITKGVNGTYTINESVAKRVKTLHKELKDAGQKANLDDLREYLGYFGISLNNMTLPRMANKDFFVNSKELSLLDRKNGKEVGLLANNQLVDLLKNNLDKALESSKQLVFSPADVKNKTTQQALHLLDTEITSAIKPLLQADNNVSYTPMQSMYIAGKMINSFEQPKLINNIVSKLKTQEYRNDLKRAAITNGSFTVEMLDTYPDLVEEYFDVVKISLEALKLRGDKSRDDAGISELSERDKLVSSFAIFTDNKGEVKNTSYSDDSLSLRKGAVFFPALSDSSQLPIFRTVLFNLKPVNLNAEFTRLENEVLDMLIDKMVRPELLRTAQYLKVNKNSNIEFFDKGARLITSFESLNKLLLTDTSNGIEVVRPLLELFTGNYENSEGYRDNIDSFIDKYRDFLRDEVSSNINDIVNKYVSEDGTSGKFVDNDLFNRFGLNKDLFDKKYIEDKGIKDSPLFQARMLAYDYTVNFVLQQREIQTLFAGDIANYAKSSSLNKLNDIAINNSNLTVDKLLETNYPDLSKEQKEEIKRDILTPEGRESIRNTYPDLLSAYDVALNDVNQTYEDTNKAYETIFRDIFSEISNNLSKRLKGQISPGNLFPNSKGKQEYYQIFLKDVDTISDSIKYFMEVHYPGEYQKVESKVARLKELDNILTSTDTYNKSAEEYEKAEKEFKSLRKELGNSYPLIAGYFKNAATDAQEYATWRDNLNQLYLRGNISKSDFDTIYKKFEAQEKDVMEKGYITEQNRWSEEEADLRKKSVMQPTKPLYSGIHHSDYKNENGDTFTASRYIYIKSSSFPLIPEVMEKFPNMKNLGINLGKFEKFNNETGEVTRTVRASYGSANKVGAISSPISMTDMYNPNLLENNPGFLGEYSVKLDRENFFIQQDKPFKADKNAAIGKRDEVNIATQFEKIILGDGINRDTRKIFNDNFDPQLIEDYNSSNPDSKIVPEGGKVSGEDLYKIYNSIYSKLQKIYADDLKREFGLEEFNDLDKKEPAAMQKLVEVLNGKLSSKQAKQSISLIYTVNINGFETNLIESEYLRHLSNGGEVALRADLKVPLWLSPDSNKFQSVLGSMINKNSVNKKIAGFSSPVASSQGFKIEGFDKNDPKSLQQLKDSGLIISSNFNPAEGLKSTRREDGTLKFAQVFIANKFKVYNKETSKYDFVDLTKYIDKDTNTIDTSKLPEDLLSMFSFRIPTSSHQSGTVIEIAGFLPHSSADLMIVPSEHTTQIGEDYDIDTRYVYTYNLMEDKDGNLSRMNYSHLSIDPTQMDKIESAYRHFQEVLNNQYYEAADGTARIKNPIFKHNWKNILEINKLQLLLDNWEDSEFADMKSAIAEEFADVEFNKKAVRDRIQDLELDIIPRYVIQSKKEELRQEYRTLKNQLKEEYKNRKNTFVDYYRARNQKINESKVLENNLISMYKSVFSSDNSDVQGLITKVLSTDRAEATAGLMDSTLKSARGERYFNIYSPHTQDEIMTLGAAGKIAIGEHSNAVTFNSILQQSPYEHKLMREEGVPYGIRLGNFIFDGVLGRIERNGIRLSELAMEDQNSATDNQKLQIMARRNENRHTMSVLKILHANGIERELDSKGKPFTAEYNGETIELSYAGLFLNQPILRRYSQLMDKYNSVTLKNYGDVNELVKDWLLDGFGEGITWAKNTEGKSLRGTLPEDSLETIGKKLNSQYLFENLIEGDNTDQWYIFQAFLDLKQAASDYGEMQKIINIEREGMGVSYFNIINLKEKLFTLADTENNKITNAEKLIGDFILVEEGSDVVPGEGYIPIKDKRFGGGTLYIKPSTPQGHKIVNSVKAGYEMFSSLFPFEQGEVATMMDTLVKDRNFKKENTKTEVELRQDSLLWMKDYMYSGNKSLFNGNIKKESYDLFFDRTGHESLASYMSRLKNDPEGRFNEIFTSPFFKDLEFDLNFNDQPSIIKFNTSDPSSIASLTVHNTVKSMINSDRVLLQRNGETYREKDLIRDLFKYSMLADQGKGAIGFRKVFDISMFDSTGVSSSLRTYSNPNSAKLQNLMFNGPTKALSQVLGNVEVNGKISYGADADINFIKAQVKMFNDYIKGKFDVDNMYTINEADNTVSVRFSDSNNDNAAFIRQVYQHNPTNVKTQFKKDSSNPMDPGASNSPIKKLLRASGFTVQDLDDNNVSHVVYKDKNGESPNFIVLQDRNNKLRLFEHYGNGYFEQIPTLGTFGFNEYEMGTPKVKSLIPENNPKEYVGRRLMNIGVTKQVAIGEGRTKQQTLDNIINTILNDKTHPLRAVLSAINPHINRDDVSIKVIDTDRFNGAIHQNEDGTYTIYLNSAIFNQSQYEVDKVIVEELLHYVTKSNFDKYITIENINFETGDIEYQENGVVPAELQVLLATYKEAIKHMSSKYGADSVREMAERFKTSQRSNSARVEQSEMPLYRSSDFHEFLAGIFFKDEEFSKEMANTEYKSSKKTILEKFADVLVRFLNRALPNKRTDTISHEVAKSLFTYLNNKTKANVSKVGPTKAEQKQVSLAQSAKKAMEETQEEVEVPLPELPDATDNFGTEVPNREYTPENITSLKPNEVFVFGSNAEGRHGKGAALLAKQKFGAVQGQAEGLQGQSYAIITKKNWRQAKSSTLEEIKEGLATFFEYANNHPEKKFYMTKLGSALAGYTVEEIKSQIQDINDSSYISDNVILPKEYEVRNNQDMPTIPDDVPEGTPRLSFSPMVNGENKTIRQKLNEDGGFKEVFGFNSSAFPKGKKKAMVREIGNTLSVDLSVLNNDSARIFGLASGLKKNIESRNPGIQVAINGSEVLIPKSVLRGQFINKGITNFSPANNFNNFVNPRKQC